MINMTQLDLKDKKILLELELNSRQSFSSIAKKVGLSKEVVNYRVNKLIKKEYKSTYLDRKSTRLNSSHTDISRMPSSA